MPRRYRIPLIILAIVLFLAISVLLARFLSVENAERDAELALLSAQAQGNVQGMLDHLQGCEQDPVCVAVAKVNAAVLRRPGAVKILDLKSPTAYSPTAASGTTRVAWTVIGRLPVVQCVRVRRTGNILSGVKVQLLSVSAPIPNTADC